MPSSGFDNAWTRADASQLIGVSNSLGRRVT